MRPLPPWLPLKFFLRSFLALFSKTREAIAAIVITSLSLKTTSMSHEKKRFCLCINTCDLLREKGPIVKRILVKMATNNKATLHLWHPLAQYCKMGTPIVKNTTQYKWHPTKMASQKMAADIIAMATYRYTTTACY